MQGRAFKFGDNISTDHIAPGRLFHLRSDLQEFAKHVLEDADENFAKEIIEANGGSIDMKSDKGEGTEVIIKVPIKKKEV